MPKSKRGSNSVWRVKTKTHCEGSSPVASVNVSESGLEDDPWMKMAGIWKDDPDWELFQAEIQGYRSLVNAKNSSD